MTLKEGPGTLTIGYKVKLTWHSRGADIIGNSRLTYSIGCLQGAVPLAHHSYENSPDE